MSARTGRNNAFDATGNALTAGAMGAAGQYYPRAQYSSERQCCAPLALPAFSLKNSVICPDF
jgi:hypothetical protein